MARARHKKKVVISQNEEGGFCGSFGDLNPKDLAVVGETMFATFDLKLAPHDADTLKAILGLDKVVCDGSFEWLLNNLIAQAFEAGLKHPRD